MKVSVVPYHYDATKLVLRINDRDKKYRKLIPESVYSDIRDPVKRQKAAERWAQQNALDLIRESESKEKLPKGIKLSEFWSSETMANVLGQVREASQDQYKSAYKCHIEPELGKAKLTDLSTARIRKFESSLREKRIDGTDKALSASSQRVILIALSKILQAASEAELIGKVPDINYPPRSRSLKMPLTDSQYDLILQCARRIHHVVYVSLLLGGDAGFRRGEILGLTWDRVNFDQGWILIDRQVNKRGKLVPPKSDESIRKVKMTSELRSALETLRTMYPKAERVIVSWLSGESVSRSTLYRWSKATTREANYLDPSIKVQCGMHTYRRTCATLVYAASKDIRAVQSILGHSDLNTTKGYVTDLGADAAVDALDEYRQSRKAQLQREKLRLVK